MTYTPYAVNQARDIFPLIDFEPEWLIDCGPGLGQEAHRFKERWPNINVLGFEPSPFVHDLIRKDYPGVLVCAAVTAKAGRMTLHQSDVLMGSTLIQGGIPSESVEVDCLALDDLPSLVGCRNAILWADVEGSELSVLQGAARLFAEGAIRLISVEVHDGEEERAMDAACEALGFEKVLTYAGNGWHHDNVYRRLHVDRTAR